MLLDCNFKKDLQSCAKLIENGGIVIYPTDTVYAIGCNPFNNDAVRRLFAIKGRGEGKQVPVLAGSIKEVLSIAIIPSKAKLLIDKYWPGALTLVLPLVINHNLAHLVHNNTNSVAIRIPESDCAQKLLRICRLIVGTSANISGMPSIKNPRDVETSGLVGFDAILDGGLSPLGIESTIVDMTLKQPRIIREGAIKKEEIYKALDGWQT